MTPLVAMNVIPPPTYVERFPRRGPWTPAADPPPPFAFTTQLLFASGETGPGVWTGALWWRSGEELKPLGWRWVDDFGFFYAPAKAG